MDQLDLIRAKTDVVDLISSYIPIKKAGRNFKALCPFHAEKTPSFVISPERQIWKCFGCGKGGDVFKFLMEYENMTFIEALRFLADKLGIKLQNLQPSSAQQERERLLSINHLSSEFYHYILLNHPAGKQGLEYLLKRGIGKSAIQLFKLGYAPNNWETLWNYLVRKKNYQAKDLEKVGLIIKSAAAGKFYDRFRGRIIFPLTDQRSNILGFSGRTIRPDIQEAKYINSPETTLYHKGELFYGLSLTKEAIKKKDQAVIVEGELDVISSYQAGTKNVIAIKGSALTEPQVNLIKRFTSTITLALDADAAGDAAMRRGIEIADAAGLNIRITQPLYGKDPDECARHSPGLWKESVEKAIPVFDFYVKSATSRFNGQSVEGKKKISEELVPILANITNEVIKAHYLKKLANILEVDEEIVIKEMERWRRLKQVHSYAAIKTLASKPVKKAKSRWEMLEELLLSLILQKDEDVGKLIGQVNIEHLVDPVLKKIFEHLKKFVMDKKKYTINSFTATLPEELVETTDRLYLQDLQDIMTDESKFLREWGKTIKELEKFYLKDQLTKLTQQIREQEQQGEKDNLMLSLQEKFTVFSKRLKDLSQE
jgi:DNA primase